MAKWEITYCDFKDKDLVEKYFKEGWEPFSVGWCGLSAYITIWLRRIKKDKNENIRL